MEKFSKPKPQEMSDESKEALVRMWEDIYHWNALDKRKEELAEEELVRNEELARNLKEFHEKLEADPAAHKEHIEAVEKIEALVAKIGEDAEARIKAREAIEDLNNALGNADKAA